MDPNEIFIKAQLVDKVKLSPRALCKNKTLLFQNLLAERFEGVCTYHGYIKKGSVSVIKYTAGIIKDVFLNGDVEYHVTYDALVCNPAIGSTVRAKVVNQNMFGILGEVSVLYNGQTIPVLEIIITKMTDVDAASPLDDVKIGDMINVEILKKKFELGDEKILNVGKIIKNGIEKHELDGGGFNSDDDELDEEPDVLVGGEDEDADADADADPDADADADPEAEDKEGAESGDDEGEESEEEDDNASDEDDDDFGASAGGSDIESDADADADAGCDVEGDFEL